MARGSQEARTAATSAQNISNTATGNAGALYSTLAPQLMNQAAHPPGMDPTTLAKMDTAVQDSAGGGQAAAVGAGALRAARTRNAGGSDAAIAESSRAASQAASKGVLGTQLANAELKAKQMSEAQRSLGGLYSANLGAGVDALGAVAGNVNADVNAKQQSWDWLKLPGMFLQAGAQAAPTIAKAFGG
jgi:hypothetical protein